MAISYKKITPFDSAFSLVRTNPKLTGNVKLLVDTKDNLFLESIDANAELAKDQYKGYQLDPRVSHDTNLYRFFNNGSTPESIVFGVKQEVSIQSTSTKFEDQYDFSEYFSGTRYCKSKYYSEKYKYFAPLYLNRDLPENFIIFKVPGASNTTIIESQAAYPYDKDAHIKQILANAIIIRTVDLSSTSNIGKYIRNYQANRLYPENALNYIFENSKLASYRGISYKTGCLTEKFENLQELHLGGKLISDFEEYVTLGFERNGLIHPHILNLEFLFDDSGDDFEFNRYFGVYCNSIDLEELSFDLSNHAALELNSPKIRSAVEYEHAQKTIVQTNNSGLELKVESISESSQQSLTNLNNLGVLVIDDKAGNFHKLTNIDTQTSKLKISTKSLDLSLLHGPTSLFLEDFGESSKTPIRSFIEITINDIPNHLDKLRVFFPNGKDLNQNVNRFETITAIKNITHGEITGIDVLGGTPIAGLSSPQKTGVPAATTSGEGYDAEFTITLDGNYEYSASVTNGGYLYEVNDLISIAGSDLLPNFTGSISPDNDLTIKVTQIDSPDALQINPGDYLAVYNTEIPDDIYFSISTTSNTAELSVQLNQIATSLTGALNAVQNSGFTAYCYENRIFVILDADGDASAAYGIQYIPIKEEIKIKVSDYNQAATQVDSFLAVGQTTQLDLTTKEYIVYGEAPAIINGISIPIGTIITGTSPVTLTFGAGNLSQTYLVDCPIIRFETGSNLESHISINSEYRDKIHDNINRILIQSKDGWAKIKNVVSSIDKINENSFGEESSKIAAVNYYDTRINILTELGTEAQVKNTLFQIREEFKPKVKVLSISPIKDFDFDKVDSQYSTTPDSDLWKTLAIPPGVKMINLRNSAYRVYSGTIKIGDTVYQEGDLIEKTFVSGSSGTVTLANKLISVDTSTLDFIEGAEIIAAKVYSYDFSDLDFGSANDLIEIAGETLSSPYTFTGISALLTVLESIWPSALIENPYGTYVNITDSENIAFGSLTFDDGTTQITIEPTIILPIEKYSKIVSINQNIVEVDTEVKNPLNLEISSGSLVAGIQYKVKTQGTNSNFSNVGSPVPNPQPGTLFTATTSASPTEWGSAVLIVIVPCSIYFTSTPAKTGAGLSYTVLSGDPIVIPALSAIESITRLDVELADQDPDILNFKGFFTITADHAEIPIDQTLSYTYRDKFISGAIKSEYDSNYERYVLELESKNRLVKYVCKWGADGALDARSNPYRLNADTVFGINNFSPDSTKFDPDPNLLTHEWFYIESLYDYILDPTASAQNKLYFDKPFDLTLAVSQSGYFDDYFIYTPFYLENGIGKPSARTQYRFSSIKKDELSGIAKTIFKGVKYLFKEVDLLASEREANGKLKYVRNSARFNNYKFSAILKIIEDSPLSGELPIKFKFIESVDYKFIVVVIELRLFGKNLSLLTNSDINTLTVEQTNFSEEESLYKGHVINHLEESFSDYRINFTPTDTSKISDITLAFLYYAKNKKYNTKPNTYSSVNLVNSLDLSGFYALGARPFAPAINKETGIILTDEIVKPLDNTLLAFREADSIKLLGSVSATQFGADFPVKTGKTQFNLTSIDFSSAKYLTRIEVSGTMSDTSLTTAINSVSELADLLLTNWSNLSQLTGFAQPAISAKDNILYFSGPVETISKIRIGSSSTPNVADTELNGDSDYTSYLTSGQYINASLPEFSTPKIGITSESTSTLSETILNSVGDTRLNLYNFYKNGAFSTNTSKLGELQQPTLTYTGVTVESESNIITLGSSPSDIKIGAVVDIPEWTQAQTQVISKDLTANTITVNKDLLSGLVTTIQLAIVKGGTAEVSVIEGINRELTDLITLGKTVYITGTNIPTNTTILSINNDSVDPNTGLIRPTITMSANATGTDEIETSVRFYLKSTAETATFYANQLINNLAISERLSGTPLINLIQLENLPDGTVSRVNPNTEVQPSQASADFLTLPYLGEPSLRLVSLTGQSLQGLLNASGLAQVLSTGVTFTLVPGIALPEITAAPTAIADLETDSVSFTFNNFIKRTQTIPLRDTVYWQNTPFAMLLGGAEQYSGIFKNLSFAAFKRAISQGLANISYTTYKNGTASQNEFYVEIEEPAIVEKLKIPTLTPVLIEHSELQNETAKGASNLVGYTATESFLQQPIFLKRHSSTYSPIFREVTAFMPVTQISNTAGSIINANCQFNPNANRFFEVKGFEHIKVSNSKILDLENSDKYRPVFTLVDETPISTADLYLLASDWDFGFHKYYINKRDKIDTFGSRRIEEDHYFMSKLSSLPTSIQLDQITSQKVDQLSSISNDIIIRQADVVYSVNATSAALDVDLVNPIIKRILDKTTIEEASTKSTALFSTGSTQLILPQANLSIKVGMIVKGSGINDYTLVSSISNNIITISRPTLSNSTGDIQLSFIEKSGLYYQILDSFGIAQDTAYPEIIGDLDFTEYARQYALKNIVPNYEIEEINVWYKEEKNLPSDLIILPLSFADRFELKYKKLEGVQINIKKGTTAKFNIPLKATGRLSISLEVKMRFI